MDDPECTAWIFDGMAVLQVLKDVPKAFAELSDRIFNNLLHVAKNAVRIDFVFDTYRAVARFLCMGGGGQCLTQKFFSNRKAARRIVLAF